MRLLAFILLIISAPFSALQAETVSGPALYLERIAAPPLDRFVAVLEDISRADAPAKQVGRVVRESAGNPPYSFEIAYDPGAIDPSRTYAVSASLYCCSDRVRPSR
jgi:putative lipoprotein